MDFVVSPLDATPDDGAVEIVEHKGTGHPDTICDALAETVSRTLCRLYRERCGTILHHNVDKALLRGGASRPAFGGGELLAPIEIYLAGRATAEVGGVALPIAERAEEACRQWLRTSLHALDVARHVRLSFLTRAGSAELRDVCTAREGTWLANDTSIGVGVWPPSRLESTVLAVADGLDRRRGALPPELGEDVKILAIRRDDRVALTVACAFVDRFVRDAADYAAKKQALAARVAALAAPLARGPVDVAVNAADDEARGRFYLTVTGTSAEAGDDGQVGRGNRVTGLITPYRPMSLEAVAGKNPVAHVGKVYNLAGQRIAQALAATLPEVRAAHCCLASRIGSPVTDPQLVEVRLAVAPGTRLESLRAPAEALVRTQLDALAALVEDVLDGRVRIF